MYEGIQFEDDDDDDNSWFMMNRWITDQHLFINSLFSSFETIYNIQTLNKPFIYIWPHDFFFVNKKHSNSIFK